MDIVELAENIRDEMVDFLVDNPDAEAELVIEQGVAAGMHTAEGLLSERVVRRLAELAIDNVVDDARELFDDDDDDDADDNSGKFSSGDYSGPGCY